MHLKRNTPIRRFYQTVNTILRNLYEYDWIGTDSIPVGWIIAKLKLSL